MADIAMCLNSECPSRKFCYRHEAPDNGISQAYMRFTPLEGEDRCENFIEINRGNKTDCSKTQN